MTTQDKIQEAKSGSAFTYNSTMSAQKNLNMFNDLYGDKPDSDTIWLVSSGEDAFLTVKETRTMLNRLILAGV